MAGALALTLLLAGCSSSGSNGGGGGTPTPTPVTPVINNVQPVAVNAGPLNDQANLLYASVTICVPGTTNCQTINNLQVDTGSSGLRILASQVTLSLPRSTDAASNPIANCVNFLDSTYMWGPVVTADVKFAGEVASSAPIHLVNPSGFPNAPTSCSTGGSAISGVSDLGATGILGVSVFAQDCGRACTNTNTTIPAVYYTCPASGCIPAQVALNRQLQNPVGLFPQDNNGILITLPSLPDAGQVSVAGSMIFGIGTQSNNALNAARVQTVDSSGNFSTTFNGVKYSKSFIDSGSNALFFLDAATTKLPACSNQAKGFYCPTTQTSFTAITTGINGVAWQIPFNIANALTLFTSTSNAFNNVGGAQANVFDWGLPFFFGRNVFVALEGTNAAGTIGPYWAY